MRKILLCVLLVSFLGSLVAQAKEDWIWGDDDQAEEEALDKDFITINYAKKNAHLAMVMSALVPGAGQFYADKSAFTTYIFPAIEIGLIAGLFVYQKQGNDKTKDFERYANQELITYELGDGSSIETYRYARDRQHRIEEILKGLNPVDIYEESYFRLDAHDCQHFYEDIGKYPHYVFGWADWYYTFATDASGNIVDENGDPITPIWYPGGHSEEPFDPNWKWRGNYPLWGDNIGVPVENDTHASSRMRETYVNMRNEAKDAYAKTNYFKLGLVFNHIGAAIDAVRVTRKVNRGAISDSGIRMQYYTAVRDQNLTPTLGFNWKF